MKKVSEYSRIFLLVSLLGLVIAPYLQDDLLGNAVALVILTCMTIFCVIATYTIACFVWYTLRLHKNGASFTSLGILFCCGIIQKIWYHASRMVNFLALRTNSVAFLHFALRMSKLAEQAIREHGASQDRIIAELEAEKTKI